MRSVLIILFLVYFHLAGSNQQAFGQTFKENSYSQQLDLGQLWIQDRAVKTFAAVYLNHFSDVNINSMASSVLSSAVKMKLQTPTILKVNSIQELESIRERYLCSEPLLKTDADKMLTGNIPQRIILITDDPNLQAHIYKIKQAYENKLDKKFEFPPRRWWTKILESLGIIKIRQTSFFSMLFENSLSSKLMIKYLQSHAKNVDLEPYHQQAVQEWENQIQQMQSFVLKNVDDQSKAIKDPVYQELLKTALHTYFEESTDDEKIYLGLQMMQHPEVDNEKDLLKLVLRNGNPNLQKLIQSIARLPVIPNELRTVFKTFEEDLPAASEQYAKTQIELLIASGFTIHEFSTQPIKVGTMAQVHKATMINSLGEIVPVAIRIPKPLLLEKILQEERIMNKVIYKLANSGNPNVRKRTSVKTMIEDGITLVRKETDAIQTSSAQKYADNIYSKTNLITLRSGKKINLTFKVPKIIYVEPQTGIIVMEWIEGMSFDKLKLQRPDLAAVATENWTKLWIEKALMGEGFMHADPHAGNLKFNIDQNGNLQIGILDYGMTGVADKQLQTQFVLLGLAAKVGALDTMAKFIWDLSRSESHQTSFIDFKNALLTYANKNKDMTLEKWIQWSIEEQGLTFSIEFSIMSRGYFITTQILGESGSNKNEMDLVKEIMLQNPKALSILQHFPELLSKRNVIEMAKSAFKTGIRMGIEKLFNSTSKKYTTTAIQEAPSNQNILTCQKIYSY